MIMLNGKKKESASQLKNAFDSGYQNAATSFSTLAKAKIVFQNLNDGFHTIDDAFNEQNFFTRTGSYLLLTTEIFGDVTGKSYLLFSTEDFNILTREVPESKDPNLNLKEEFAKELDNILSASVITKLSNTLHCKMYGDIPILVGTVSARVEDLIYDDFSEQGPEIYINAGCFSMENNPSVRPLFIWVVDSHTLPVHEINGAH